MSACVRASRMFVRVAQVCVSVARIGYVCVHVARMDVRACGTLVCA